MALKDLLAFVSKLETLPRSRLNSAMEFTYGVRRCLVQREFRRRKSYDKPDSYEFAFTNKEAVHAVETGK